MLPPGLAAKLRDIAQAISNLAETMPTTPTPGTPRTHRLALYEAIDQIAALVSRGTTEHEAVYRVAYSGKGLDFETLRAAWEQHRKKHLARDLHARRLMVRYLTDQRWKDADIARLLGVHVKHIPRMRRALREREEEARQRE